MTVFIRRAPVKDNTASECIRTVATTYGCKILQLYEYGANVYRYDANCERHPKNNQPVHAALKAVDYRVEVFLHQSTQYMF